MEGLGLTWFDGVAIVIVAFSGVMAFARGLIREVFSIVAFIGAAVAAIYLAGMPQAIGFVEQMTTLRGPLAALAAGLAIFLAVFVIITIITSFVARQAHQSAEIGGLDRLGGAIFGVLRGVLVVALFVLLMLQTTDDRGLVRNRTIPADITGAKTYGMFETIANGLGRILPGAAAKAKSTAKGIYDRQKARSDSAGTQPAPAPGAAPPPADTAPPAKAAPKG
jgi:membrane protein required for colicin V production